MTRNPWNGSHRCIPAPEGRREPLIFPFLRPFGAEFLEVVAAIDDAGVEEGPAAFAAGGPWFGGGSAFLSHADKVAEKATAVKRNAVCNSRVPFL